MDPVDAARRLVDERLPNAVGAFLAGSVLTAARTPRSDLDIVVIRADDQPVFRETLRYADWPVELFVQTPTSYERFLTREIAARRSPLLSMISTSVVLVDHDGVAACLQADARRRRAHGPPAVTVVELEDLQDGLSDLLDDLDGTADPNEMSFVAVQVFADTARLALTLAGTWLGGGKMARPPPARQQPQPAHPAHRGPSLGDSR
ncbi:nucleotidyltransferase domain-containing protein [Phytohabitans rumicis]|uniref:Nucleotidyltransferase n=1 Tax=Phytohabitans rumicis TaxID=1076125 RepID=A0A6V8L7F0_9ACTN|nr:nucleotidyltransferase domain-containing protein [Phytohabitans rumicis]GFJ89927.1 nucleotidyltransferase [Phytohabitans rumicis]